VIYSPKSVEREERVEHSCDTSGYKMQQKAKVEIYTWDQCPFCQRTIALLDSKGVQYERYRIDGDESAREKMAIRAHGKKSVPQVFIDDKHVGGCDDVHAIDAKGELDKLIFE